MKTEEYLLPAWTLSALINDDWSGLIEEDEKSLEAFLERGVAEHGTFFALCPEEAEPSFYRSNDLNNLGDNCLEVTFCISD